MGAVGSLKGNGLKLQSSSPDGVCFCQGRAISGQCLHSSGQAFTMSKLVVALAQINPVVGDVRGNVDRCMASYRTARAQHGAEVVVLPELALLGCPHGDLVWRAGIRRQLEQELARLAAAVEEGWLIVGYPRATETGLVNVARSEERRVGKERRAWGVPEGSTKNARRDVAEEH